MSTPAIVDEKLQALQYRIRAHRRVIVAFSGGVDSTFVLKVTLDCLGAENVLAVTADSPSVPRKELQEAKALAEGLGATHRVIETHELDDPRYAANPKDRCYYCRLDLHSKLRAMADDKGFDGILCGVNADDLGDFRPGLRAAAEYGIESPCADAGVTKEDIRRLSKELGLSTHDRPANPCLSTRIAYGIPITCDVLTQIERAEETLRRYGLREFRVRHHGNLARIEVPPGRIAEFVEPARREEVVRSLREIGYHYVTIDLQGFRSGSMNEAIEAE